LTEIERPHFAEELGIALVITGISLGVQILHCFLIFPMEKYDQSCPEIFNFVVLCVFCLAEFGAISDFLDAFDSGIISLFYVLIVTMSGPAILGDVKRVTEQLISMIHEVQFPTITL